MAQLKKYRLKNVTPEMTRITLGTTVFYFDQLTDEQAEILYRDGQSNYIELVPIEEPKPENKKSTSK